MFISASEVGLGCGVTSASVSEGWAADATRAPWRSKADKLLRLAWKKAQRSHPENLVLFICRVQTWYRPLSHLDGFK